MLQKFNERIQGIFAWLIIIVIAITFTFFGLDYYLQSRSISNVKAEVNNQKITKESFENAYRRARAQRDSAPISAKEEKQFQKIVLNRLIENKLIAHAARISGFEVGAAQANATILAIPQFQEEGSFSPERYKLALSGALYTPETFKNEVRQGMLLNQLRFAFIGTSFVLPKEVKQFIRLFMQTRNYQYLTIPNTLFKNQITVSENEIKTYYENHPKEFMTKEKVSLNYIRLSMNKIASKVSIPDEELKAYYDENQQNYQTPAKWLVSHILFAVPKNASKEEKESIQKKAETVYNKLKKKPDLFNKWVEKYSDDKLSAANNGKLPWLTAGQTEYDKALMDLTKAGELSSPIKTKHGYEIFKVLDYQPAKIKPFSEVKEKIKKQRVLQHAQSEYSRALDELSDLSYQNPDSLKEVAKILNLNIETTKPFSRKGGDSAISQNKKIIDSAYSHDVLELGNNSDPIQISDDEVVVIRVRDHLKPTQIPLQEAKNTIRQKLLNQKAIEKTKTLGKALVQSSAEQEKQLVKKYQLKWKKVAKASRDTDKVDADINELAFDLSKSGEQKGRLLERGNYVIVKLTSINDGSMEQLDKEQQKSIRQQIAASYGMKSYELYVNGLLEKAEIKHY